MRKVTGILGLWAGGMLLVAPALVGGGVFWAWAAFGALAIVGGILSLATKRRTWQWFIAAAVGGACSLSFIHDRGDVGMVVMIGGGVLAIAAVVLAARDARSRVWLPVLSGLLYWMSFHPCNLGPLAWIALVPLAVFARSEESCGRTAWLAYVGGFVCHSLLYCWVRHTLPIGPVGVGFYMGFYWMVAALILRWTRRVPIALALPAAWVTVEFTWSYVLGGLPYNAIGYTQHALLSFIQVADLGGIWLVSFIVAAVNGAVARVFFTPREAPAWRDAELRLSIVAASLLVVGATVYGVVRLATLPLIDGPTIAVIQPNIAQDWKELAAAGIGWEQQEKIFRIHVDLTDEAAKLDPKPALICWPESAIFERPLFDPLKQNYNRGSVVRLLDVAENAGVPIALGVVVWEFGVADGTYVDECERCGRRQPAEVGGKRGSCPSCGGPIFPLMVPCNSALLLSPDQRILGRFDKIRLVAFSERVPLPFVSGIIAKLLNLSRVYEFRPGTATTPWSAAGVKLAPEVCYEAAYPEISRNYARSGAQVCVNVSNEGWFADSAELDYMLAMARFRAIESRVHYLRATNTGISAFIEPTGRIQKVLEVAGKRKNVKGVLAATCRITPSGSLFRTVGDAVAWLCGALSLAGIVVSRLMSRKVDRS